jgi:hypothetical protein
MMPANHDRLIAIVQSAAMLLVTHVLKPLGSTFT